MNTYRFLFLFIFITSNSIGQTFFQNRKETLSKRWLLKDDSTKLFKVTPYKPVYVLFANYTSAINNLPTSPNPLNTVTTPTLFSDTELKFQLSFK